MEASKKLAKQDGNDTTIIPTCFMLWDFANYAHHQIIYMHITPECVTAHQKDTHIIPQPFAYKTSPMSAMLSSN